MIRKFATAAAMSALLMSAAAQAQDKPAELRIGISTFLSGSASVFGEPAKQAADMLVDEINKSGGILGVPVKVTYIDEGAGTEQLTTDYKRLAVDAGNGDIGPQPVDDEKADREEDALAQVGRLAEHAPAEVRRHLLCSRCHVRSLSSQAPPDRSPVRRRGKTGR